MKNVSAQRIYDAFMQGQNLCYRASSGTCLCCTLALAGNCSGTQNKLTSSVTYKYSDELLHAFSFDLR